MTANDHLKAIHSQHPELTRYPADGDYIAFLKLNNLYLDYSILSKSRRYQVKWYISGDRIKNGRVVSIDNIKRSKSFASADAAIKFMREF